MIEAVVPPADVPALVERAVAVFARHPEVICAYLFGSQAHGRATPLSDLDFAVLRNRCGARDPRAWQSDWGDLHGELVHALRLADDAVDLVLLDEVSDPLLRHRTTWGGRLILCRDHRARVRTEAGILLAYLDTTHLRAIQRDAVRRAFRPVVAEPHGR